MTTYIIAGAALWYALGVVLFVATILNIGGEFKVKDVFISIIAGLFGPCMLFWYLMYTRNDFYNKTLFRIRKG